jgi:hypothetical protein
MFRVGIEKDDFAEVSVEVRKVLHRVSVPLCMSDGPGTYLDDLALDVSRGFTVKLVWQVRLERVELFRDGHGSLCDEKISRLNDPGNGWTHVERLRSE